MTTPSADVAAALVRLRTRWGAAAPRPATEVIGALAVAPLPDAPSEGRPDGPSAERELGRVHPTGFAALDAILGVGGLQRGTLATFRGAHSSGRTTLALRLAAEAQSGGAIVAWLDLAGAFDPVEAVARGVRLEWLVVLSPADLEEALAMAGALAAGRTVDLLVVDLPGGPSPRPASRRTPPVGDRLGRLAALARRSGVSVIVLEPSNLAPDLARAVAEAAGIRLELARRSWVHLGRDVVGQRTEVVVARNRAGPSGRRATLRILYADGGERDACLRRDGLLAEPTVNAPAILVPGNRADATPPSPQAAPPPRPGPAAPWLRLVAGGPGRPGRPAVVGRDGPGRGSGRPGARRPARDAARHGGPAGAGGRIPRASAGG